MAAGAVPWGAEAAAPPAAGAERGACGVRGGPGVPWAAAGLSGGFEELCKEPAPCCL